jgi:hypothetical protein
MGLRPSRPQSPIPEKFPERSNPTGNGPVGGHRSA